MDFIGSIFDEIQLSQERTLYVDQFTCEIPTKDEYRNVLCPKCLKDVFDLYQPCIKNVELKTEEGDIVFENFKFQHITDFDDEQLISQSENLSHLYERKNTNPIARQCLKSNLHTIHKEIKTIEMSYRTLAMFFDNASTNLDGCLTLMNVNKDELKRYDSDGAIAVRDIIESYNSRISLKMYYSFLVIPGYLGDASTIKMWAKFLHHYWIILLTDYLDYPDFDKLRYELDRASLQGQDVCLSNVVMTCNYVVPKHITSEIINEYDLYLPASAAVAGKITNNTKINNSQDVSGKKQGRLANIKETHISLSEVECEILSGFGVIPIIHYDENIYPVSNKTLYNGENVGLNEYPIVCLLHQIEKSVRHLILGNLSFWNAKIKHEMIQTLQEFLNKSKGPRMILNDYYIIRFDKDPRSRATIVEIELKILNLEKPVNLNIVVNDEW